MKPQGTNDLKGSLKVEEVKALQRALAAARLKQCACKQEAQDEMRIYLDTWVVYPIESVLKALEKRHDKKKMAKEVSK